VVVVQEERGDETRMDGCFFLFWLFSVSQTGGGEEWLSRSAPSPSCVVTEGTLLFI
jgi:hypothetical protein